MKICSLQIIKLKYFYQARSVTYKKVLSRGIGAQKLQMVCRLLFRFSAEFCKVRTKMAITGRYRILSSDLSENIED